MRVLHPALDARLVSVAIGVANWCVGGQDEKVSSSVNHISSVGTSYRYHCLCCECEDPRPHYCARVSIYANSYARANIGTHGSTRTLARADASSLTCSYAYANTVSRAHIATSDGPGG